MRILVLLLITLLGCGACKEQRDHKGKTPLVEVDGNFLYKEDLMSVLPVGLSKDDSILFTEHYIRSWAEAFPQAVLLFLLPKEVPASEHRKAVCSPVRSVSLSFPGIHRHD